MSDDVEKDSKKKVGILRGFFGLLKIVPSDTEEDDGLKHNYNSEERDHDLEIGLEGRNLETRLEKRIADLEEFNRFLRSDIVDISLLEKFKRRKERKQFQL